MPQLPKIILGRLAGLGSSEHPDADLLTAYIEGVLGGRERHQLSKHLSDCTECRQVIALALPDSNAQVLSASAAGGRTSWLRMPVLRWGALAACVVVVAAIGLIQKREQSSHHQVQVALQQSPPAVVANRASTAPGYSEGALSQSEVKAKSRRSSAPKAEPTPKQLASAGVPATPPPSANAASDLMQTTENVQVKAEAAPAESAPSPRTDQQLRARNSTALAKAAPLFTARPSTETAASTIGGAARLTDLRAPNWRLSEDGLPERSFASGQWEKVQVDHKAGFRAIASLGMEVWIGGRGGILYHSEDMGLNWTRVVPVSNNAKLSDDVARIAFTDHMHGTIATEGGQNWVTSDAGKTWELE